MIVLDYFIYDLVTGELLSRLTSPAGLDRKATMAQYPGRGIIVATVPGIPADQYVVQDGQLQRKEPLP